MNKKFFNFLQFALVSFDLATLNIIFLIAYYFLDRIPGFHYEYYIFFNIFINVVWIITSYLSGLYSKLYTNSFEDFSKKTISVYVSWVCLSMLYLFFLQQFEISRLFLSICFLCYCIMLVINRLLCLLLFHYLRQNGQLRRNVLILGYNKLSKKIVHYLETNETDTKIVGFCEEASNINELTHYPIVSEPEDALKAAIAYNVNEIYSTISPEQDTRIYKIMQQADDECIRFKIIPDLTYFVNQAVSISFLKDIPIISLRKEPLDEYSNRLKKRVIDIVVSTFMIVFILSWMIPIIGLLIFIESKGPIFFVQYRSGKNKIPFRCLKFRSMRINSQADTAQATKDDTRFTKVGKFIRKTSLDEFPQFINVLKGEMSIVGPRPHMLKHTDEYSKLINKYMIRQFLKPGITGWAQVNGFRGETKTVVQMQKRVEHDIWYMENWSLWLDVRIMFLTCINSFKGEVNAF